MYTKLKSLLLPKFNLSDKKLTLLYRASRDGFQADNFHANCDNKAITLTIVKTKTGQIFGGYTKAKWNSNYENYQNDENAFIFSLINNYHKPLIFSRNSNNYSSYNNTSSNRSIYCNSNYGPGFGSGPDFRISNCSNENTNSSSILGHTYTHSDLSNGYISKETILAGSPNFKVAEIEVFQID